MSVVYPRGKDAAWSGAIDLESDDVRVQLLADTADYDPTDQVLADLGSVLVGTSVTVPSLSLDSGELSSLVASVTVPSVPAGDTVRAAVLYIETGSPATRRLVAWVDTNPDTTPIDLTTNGDDIEVGIPDPLCSF